MEIDAGEHIPLIYRVIHQMGLSPDQAEEAFSESLVTITEAAKTYDPSKNVPVANWLAQNIRWGIYRWLGQQKPLIPLEFLPEEPHAAENASAELKEVLRKADKVLDKREKLVLMGLALGYSGREIATAMGINPVMVTVIKQRVQRKLRD